MFPSSLLNLMLITLLLFNYQWNKHYLCWWQKELCCQHWQTLGRATNLFGVLHLLLNFCQHLLPACDVVAQLRRLHGHALQLLLFSHTKKKICFINSHHIRLGKVIPLQTICNESPCANRGHDALSNCWLEVRLDFCQFSARCTPGKSPGYNTHREQHTIY